MDKAMIRIFQRLFAAVLFQASLHHVKTQNSREPILLNSISAPDGLAVGSFINSVTQEKVIVGWIPDLSARTYTIRLYTREDDVLQREITNIKTPVMVIEDLESGTKYSITVSAVYENANGLLVESVESDPLEFDTREECRGGQIWTECDGGCIAMCDNPDPVCSRQCQPGCNCPLEANIWDGFACVVAELCPPGIGFPVQVENLRVIDSTSAHVVLGWDINLGAYTYEVTVRLQSNRSAIVLTERSDIPVIRLTGLTPGIVYNFGVVAFVRSEESIRPRSALLPPRYQITQIQDTSFTVSWSRSGDSLRYAFVLYDETGRNILYENLRIGGTSIRIDELAPGTIYFFSIAAAGPNEDVGIYSRRTLVRTLGEKEEVNPNEMFIEHMIELPATTVRPSVFTNITVTNCLQEYQGVERFYQRFPDSTTGPRYPNCQDNGLYVPTLCEVDNPEDCHCIREDDKERRKGSDFGGDNSHFPLDCSRYGELEVEDLNLRLGQIRSSTIEVMWDPTTQAHSYILYVQNNDQPADGRTIAINAALNEYTLENLIPGSTYEIGIYVVDASGGASPLVTMEAITSLVDRPERLRVLSSVAANLTIQWQVDATAEAYSVRLILKEENVVMEELDQIFRDRVTFTNLTALTRYVIEIRAVGFDYARNSDETSLHFSDPASIEVLVTCDLSPLDIIFAIESSGPTRGQELLAMKNLAANLLRALPEIEENTGTRVGALRFNNNPNFIFNYDRFQKTANSVGALRYIRYLGGAAPDVGRMMSGVTTRYFTNPTDKGYRMRPDALSVVMIFTSGRTTGSLTSTPPSYTSQARTLRRHTFIVTVGVTGWSNERVLRTIAGNSDLNIMFPSFEELESSVEKVLERLCLIPRV